MTDAFWAIRPLAELVISHDHRRSPVKASDRIPGPYPYYGASGIVDWVNDYLFDGVFLLIAEDGENLRTRKTPVAFIATGQFWVNNHAHVVMGNEYSDTRFLSYAVDSANIRSYLTGSTMPKLTQSNLMRLPVITPPLAEQQAIAEVLGALDDKIELNRRMNATLEELARTIFRSWFVDFDPVHAKAEGRAPFGMDADTAALFPDSFVPSELGDIPNGWTTLEVKYLANLSRQSIQPQQFALDEFELYSLPAFDSGRMPARVNGSSIKSGKFVVPKDSILLSKLNPTIPRVWLPDVRGAVSAITSTEFLVFRPTHEPDRGFMYFLFQDRGFRNFLVGHASGTSNSHQRVRPSDVLEQMIVCPADQPRDVFNELVSPMIERIAANLRESQTLAELRDTLLPKLLSGEITVRRAEHEMAGAV